jgi:hypothetical protein
MPCDTIQLNKVSIKAANRGLLGKAIEALGYNAKMLNDGTIVFTHKGRQVKVTDSGVIVPVGEEALADKIKTAYSAEVLKVATQKFSWGMLKGKKANTYTLVRRF